MKTARATSYAPFPDSNLAPQHTDILGVIGADAASAIAKLHGWFEGLEESAYETKYSAAAGWYEIGVVKRRRVFYFIPKHEDFTLNLVVGPRAIMSLVGGPHASTIARLLKSARYYPEGTLFSFDRNSFDPAIVIALCQAKLARH